MHPVTDSNIKSITPLPTPIDIISKITPSQSNLDFIQNSRQQITNILFGNDPRLLLIVGPCSIHDIDSGIEYAQKFKTLSSQVQDKFLLVMRAYFEKPRTSFGWQGMILDPHLDNSKDILSGLNIARNFLLKLTQLQIPAATELLDPITPQYIADLISWSAIGARTTESQTHRQLASGLSMPIGFKNNTEGAINVAINAINAAINPQTFMGINQLGQASFINTCGNPHCHIILRGGNQGPNYLPEFIHAIELLLDQANLKKAIVVDCSHANSSKDHNKQPHVFLNVLDQLSSGNSSIKGIMLESNLNPGKQPFPSNNQPLAHGVSITDPCIDWHTTETLILNAYNTYSPSKKPLLIFQ